MLVKSVLAVAALGLSASLVVHGPSALAQDSVCEPLLENRVAGPWAYSRREDRCEGLYVEQVSGKVLAIVSFTSAFDDFDLGTSKPLVVQWAAPGTGELRLRARSLQPKIYYRMDSRQPAEAETFRWPLEVLAGVRIGRASLGVLGSIERPLAGRERRVLVALRIGQGSGVTAEGSYELLIRPGVELHEVYLSVAAVSDDGMEEDFLVDEEALNYGFYPAERAFAVPLPALPRVGLYYISIAAELASGANATVEAYFLHSDG